MADQLTKLLSETLPGNLTSADLYKIVEFQGLLQFFKYRLGWQHLADIINAWSMAQLNDAKETEVWKFEKIMDEADVKEAIAQEETI